MKDKFGAFLSVADTESVFSNRIAVKDNIAVKGMPLTCGSLVLEDYVAPYNAVCVQKLIDAGYTIIGKTNMDEFGMGSTGEKSAFYPTLNPKYPEETPGGSSSGSAAAVAAGYCDYALGTDTGGSVRVPAACCGLYGFKPTYNAISRFGLVAYASSMDTIGIISNSVEGIKKIYNVIREKTETEFVEDIKIKDFVFDDVDNMINCYYNLIHYESSSNLRRFDGVRYGKAGKDYFGQTVKERIKIEERYDYEKAIEYRKLLISRIDEVFGDCNILRFPTLTNGARDNHNIFANLTGLPAITIPTGKMQAVELVAKRNQDDFLLYTAEKEVQKYEHT